MKQAVILAGGLGERLRPYTLTHPKPMVPVAKKPFLTYIIEDLRSKGIEHFVILAGYKSEIIVDYFKDEESVTCIETPVDFTKSERLLNARSILNDEFLLLYGDNYVPEDIGDFALNGYDLNFALYKKSPGNFRFVNGSRSLIYTPERNVEFGYVELGYLSVNKSAIIQSLEKTANLEATFMEIVINNRATAREIFGPYFSISDPIRHQLAEKAILGKKVILIDRDGVINNRMPKGEYVTEIEKCKFIEENLIGMKELSEAGFSFIIVSNQAGVARGYMSESQLREVNNFILDKMQELGIDILEIFMCLHGWNENCLCRKPNPGMLLEAARKFSLFLKKTVYIGDDVRDVVAALAANCIPVFIGDRSELESIHQNIIYAPNIVAAKDEIMNIYQIGVKLDD